jgi:streptogramin lyase
LGGLRVDTGLDSNDSGVLDALEIQHTAYVCTVAGGGSADAGDASADDGAAGTGGIGGADAGTGGTGGIVACPTLTEYDLPAGAGTLTAGPDDNLWLTSNQSVIRMTTAGVFTTFPIGSDLGPQIIPGFDGNIWWYWSPTYFLRVTPDGVITRISTDTGARGISTGPGAGYIWYTVFATAALNRITPAGQVSGRTLAQALSAIVHANGGFWGIGGAGIGYVTDHDAQPENWIGNPARAAVLSFPTSYAVSTLAAGPDGTVWFTTLLPPGPTASVRVGRISPSGELREYFPLFQGIRAGRPAPASDGAAWTLYEDRSGQVRLVRYTLSEAEMLICLLPSTGGAITVSDIALGPDGRMWFTQPSRNRIVAFTP